MTRRRLPDTALAALTLLLPLAGAALPPPRGSPAARARAVFDLLKLRVETTSFEQPLALAKLRAGEIAALAYVTGKPAPMFATLRAAEGLHFVAVPLAPQLLASYVPTRLAPEDY